jgi:hypothetical protein
LNGYLRERVYEIPSRTVVARSQCKIQGKLAPNELTDVEDLVLDQGVWAEVKVGGEHLRLFSEQNAIGVQASVYNVTAKNWIAPSEPVEDIEQGKDRATAHAAEYLLRVTNMKMPPLVWKKSRSV